MKNLIQLETKVQCSGCKIHGCFTEHVGGGEECFTCPVCDAWSDDSWDDDELWEKVMCAQVKGTDLDLTFEYCPSCRIVFLSGCIHAENGCTSQTYNAHLIGKWRYKGEIYVGMP
jgi:hypothetical protein